MKDNFPDTEPAQFKQDKVEMKRRNKMTCEKHDYHAVVVNTVTEFKSTDTGNTTTTQQTYALFCQACGATAPLKK